jgi:Skp family chaperone for outer membrane proteins
MPAVTMTTHFLIVALEGKRPETEHDRKRKQCKRLKRESKIEKERRVKAQQKKGGEQQKKTQREKKEAISPSLPLGKGAPFFFDC